MVNYGDRCDCSCHKDGAVHVRACCFICPMCGQRIKIELINYHFIPCRDDHQRWDEMIARQAQPASQD